MISWKADYGYTTSYYHSVDPTKIIWTDINRLFVLPTTMTAPVDTVDLKVPTIVTNFAHNLGNGKYSEMANLMTSYMGNDYYNIYTLPGYAALEAGLLSVIPSISLMAPNLFASPIGQGTISGCAICHIKALKRLIVLSSSSPATVAICDSETGKLLAFESAAVFFTSNGATASCLAFLGAVKQEELVKPSNYRGIAVMARSGANTDVRYSTTSFSATGYLSKLLINLFSTYSPPDGNIPVNPYEPVDPSGPGDLPPGTFDDTSDPIPDSPLPTLSAANTGFTRIYNPTLSQVQALARYLWTDESVVQTIWNKIKQYFEDPMQAILGFNLVPVPVPDGGQEEFALMYIPTGVTMTVAANQFVDVDCGTVVLDRYYGSALDQSPYTKIHAFLPFIGTVRLNTDEVMGTTLSVKYRVDIVSGSCVAKIFVDGNCLYQYSGHCAITIPISSADFSTYVSAAINVAKSLAPAVTAEVGAAMAPMSVPDIMIGTGVSGGLMPSQGAPLADYYPSIGPSSPISSPLGTPDYILGNMTPTDIANTVSQVNSGKPYIQHSGAFSGNSGYLGIRRPFLIIERPNMCLPENYQALNGYPSMITLKLGDCSGYTRIQQVQLTGITATNVEQSEIMGLLKGGVVL